MPAGRHRMTTTRAARARTLALPAAATAVTLAVVVTPLALGGSDDPAPESIALPAPGTLSAAVLDALPDRSATRPSRTDLREPLDLREAAEQPEPAEPRIIPSELEPRWLTAPLNVWTGPGEDTRLLTVIPAGSKVEVTGDVRGAWAAVARDDRVVWVRAVYLVETRPEPEPEPTSEPTTAPTTDPPTEAATGVSTAPCPDGSTIESGLASSAITAYRTICAAFPEITTWGGLRAGDDGYHGTGQALDVMTSDSELGWAIAEYIQANAAELGVIEILWYQQIWTAERAGEGWRPFEDRGSPTANHYDHVHVAVG